jgi:transmembrane 9 superfamily protein 2/4
MNETPPLLSIMLLLLLATHTSSFYLPGVAPQDFVGGDTVPLLVNALSSLDSLISYDYYHPEFHFCTPPAGPVAQRESLGAILFGDRLFTSPFEISALKTETCKTLCQVSIPPTDSTFVHDRILENYMHNWVIDGLPAAELYRDGSTNQEFYNPGFLLGQVMHSVSHITRMSPS